MSLQITVHLFHEGCFISLCVPGLSPPVVTGVAPLFGPIAGGTVVTLTGRWLNYTDSYVALYPVDITRYGIIRLHNVANSGLVLYLLVFC